MLKHTTYQDAKLYLYATVVLPLKKLNVELSAVRTPFVSKETGKAWYVELSRERVGRELRHNYERDRAEQNPNRVITITDDAYKRYPVGFYDGKRQTVVLFEPAFKRLQIPRLLGQFEQVFSSYTPFASVTINRDRQEFGHLCSKMGLNLTEMQPL